MNLYNNQFERHNEEPRYWHNKSADLLISAQILWNAMESNKDLEINSLATYKMLMGMSFELLFKAHCIGSDVTFKATHNLVELAHTAGLVTSKNEKKILKALSEYVIWDGRYPTPKNPEHLEDHWKNQESLLDGNFDFENLITLWRRFSDPLI